MPRKPSAVTPRPETTTELIARITAERNAPGRSARRGVAVLDAPERTRTVRVPAQRAPAPVIPWQRHDGSRRFSDDVLADPEADDTPTVTFEVVAPVARPDRRRHGLTHRLLPIALGAAVMIAISVYTANGFALPVFTDPGPRVGDTGSVTAPAELAVPEPGPTGPTVPAPADGPPAAELPAAELPAAELPAAGPPAGGPNVPAPAPSGGAPDVRLTDAAVPAPGY